MKALITATCVAIIAATGYYFMQEYRGSVDAAEAADAAEFRRACYTARDTPALVTVREMSRYDCRRIGIEF